GHVEGGRGGEVRVPAGGVQVRAAAARRHRVRLGPDGDAPGPAGLDPRRDRLPEGRVRLRPADGGADPDHAAAARGGRRRRRPRQGPQGRGGGRRAGAAGRELTRRNRSRRRGRRRPQRGAALVVRYTSYTPSMERTAFSTCPRCFGSPISNVKRLTATRSRVVVTDADRMLTCWSDSTRVTSDSSRGRSSASTWIATRKTESSPGDHF